MNRIRLSFAFCFAMSLSLGAAEFEVAQEPQFRKLLPRDAKLAKIAGDLKFVEGPVWLDRDGGILVFSDIPANRMYQWSADGGLKEFRDPSHHANGNTTDRKAKVLYTCEHGARRVTRTAPGAAPVTLVERFRNQRLNSPNDVVLKRDGTIWFTDPDYGIQREQREQEANFVFRFHPETKELNAVARDFDKPNGLCFSPDEKRLYVADSGSPRHIRVFDVEWDNTLSNGRIFCKIDRGGPDGIRADREGRIWSSAGDGVQIFDVRGGLIGKILTPESPANLCFGGKNGRTLFITARTSVYAIETDTKGAR